MKGHGPYSKILNWIKSENARSEFAPSIPPSFAPSESWFQNLHRLTYRVPGTPTSASSSQKVLKLEIPLEPRDAGPDADVTDLRHVLQTSGTPRMWTGYQSAADMLIPHRSEFPPLLSYSPAHYFAGQWTFDSLSKISPFLQMHPSLSFSNDMSPGWTHSE